jgi:hypothetical protein
MESIIKLFIKVTTFTHFIKGHNFYNLMQGGIM